MAEPTAQTAPAVDVEETPKVDQDQPETIAEASVDSLAPSQPESKTVTEVATPAESVDMDPKSKKVTLADLCAKGTALFSQKQYEDATEIFSRASMLQVELNGETSPENAEILFLYGRSLFKVGQQKSDVLGESAPADKPKKAPAANGKAKPAKTAAEEVTLEGVAIVANDKESEAKVEPKPEDAKKPLFQFTGDENFDDSDEEEEGGEEEEDEEDQDDLATAFQILDLARVCYGKKLEEVVKEEEEQAGKGKEAAGGDSPAVKHIKERLADTHDLLAEISLENERFPRAIEDFRTALTHKLELYPEESGVVAEAHYKLSLALEFASVTATNEDGGNEQREEMDQGLRDQAVEHMELAIKSYKLKLHAKEVELATMASPEDNDLARKAIQEMQATMSEMETRLADLRANPIDTKNLLNADNSALGGILGALVGETPAQAQSRIAEATKTATDLTGLVRKKTKDAPAAPETNGKRKAEDDDDVESEAAAKKLKTDAAAAV